MVGVGVLLAGCGGTSQKPSGSTPSCAGQAGCPSVCVAGVKFCSENQIRECAADGASSTPIEVCDADAACVTEGKVIKCQSAAADCTAGQMQCRDNNVFKCDSAGKAFRLFEACIGGASCDPVSFVCAVESCMPGRLSCDAGRVMTCNSAGNDFLPGEDCEGQGLVCYDGKCQAVVCKAGSSICQDNSVFRCQPNQVDQLFVGACQGDHCEQQTPELATCTVDPCTAGQQLCDGNTAKVCAKDGSLPPTGTDCGSDVCEGGECLPAVCKPLKLLCKESNVHLCLSPGTHTQTVDECADNFACGPLLDTVACLAKPCKGSATACLGNVRGKCAADGLSLAEMQQDCAATNQVCDAAQACNATAVDTEGKAEDVEGIAGGQLDGNVIDVHSKRRVTKLEANLLLEAPRDLRWVIYEWTGALYELKVSEITANNNGSGFFSSPALRCRRHALSTAHHHDATAVSDYHISAVEHARRSCVL